MRDARVLVTGGTGFIGRPLVNRLLREGAQVALMTRAPRGLDLPGLREVPGDLADGDSLRAAVATATPDIVFHLGGFTDPARDPALGPRAMALNLAATMTLAEAARDAAAFVHAGTGEEYGQQPAPFAETLAPDPLSPYSASKLAATHWLTMAHRSFGLRAVSCRIFLAYGPGQLPPKLIPSAIRAALRGADFPMTSGMQNREFIHVEDLCEGLIRAATTPAAHGRIVNLGTGEQMPILRVVQMIYDLARAGGAPRPGAVPDRPNDMMAYAADITLARSLLGWAPVTPLRDGLAQTIDWTRRHGDAPVPFGA